MWPAPLPSPGAGSNGSWAVWRRDERSNCDERVHPNAVHTSGGDVSLGAVRRDLPAQGLRRRGLRRSRRIRRRRPRRRRAAEHAHRAPRPHLVGVERVFPSSTLDRGSQPVRVATIGLALTVLASYVAAYARPIDAVESRGADRGMILLFGLLGLVLLAADGITTRRRLDSLLQWVATGGTAIAAVGVAPVLHRLRPVQGSPLPGPRRAHERAGHPGAKRPESGVGHRVRTRSSSASCWGWSSPSPCTSLSTPPRTGAGPGCGWHSSPWRSRCRCPAPVRSPSASRSSSCGCHGPDACGFGRSSSAPWVHS